MFGEGADHQGSEIALCQSILQIHEHPPTGFNAPLTKEVSQVRLRVWVQEDQQAAAISHVAADAVLFFFGDRASGTG